MRSLTEMSDQEILSWPCPGCGKPLPVGNAKTVRCGACDAEHRVPDKLRRAAEAYRAARANLPLQLRQTRDIDELSGQASAYVHRFRRTVAILGGPLLLLFVYGLAKLPGAEATDQQIPSVVYAPAYLAPFVVLVLTGLLAWRNSVRRREAIESLLWARPLADVPGSFGCRMCGGPLPGTVSRSVTVTCSYCRSDNVVGAAISRKAAKIAATDYARHASDVVQRLGVGEGTRDSRGRHSWSARTAIALPLLVLALLYGLGHYLESSLGRSQRLPDTSVEYTLWQCPSAPFAEVRKADRPPPKQRCPRDDDERRARPITLAELGQARLEWCGATFEPGSSLFAVSKGSRVIEVFSDGFGRNRFRIEGDRGSKGVCSVEEAEIQVKPLVLHFQSWIEDPPGILGTPAAKLSFRRHERGELHLWTTTGLTPEIALAAWDSIQERGRARGFIPVLVPNERIDGDDPGVELEADRLKRADGLSLDAALASRAKAVATLLFSGSSAELESYAKSVRTARPPKPSVPPPTPPPTTEPSSAMFIFEAPLAEVAAFLARGIERGPEAKELLPVIARWETKFGAHPFSRTPHGIVFRVEHPPTDLEEVRTVAWELFLICPAWRHDRPDDLLARVREPVWFCSAHRD